MRLSRKLIVAFGVAVAAGSSAVAVAATQGGSKSNDPQPRAAQGGPTWGGGPHGAAWAGGPRGAGGNVAPGAVRRGGPGRFDADTRGVLDAIRKAVVNRAVTVAGPIIDQAVKDGDLTQAQADTAKQALADAQAGKRPSMDAFALLRDEKIRAVAEKVVKAVAPDVPGSPSRSSTRRSRTASSPRPRPTSSRRTSRRSPTAPPRAPSGASVPATAAGPAAAASTTATRAS
ncbi:MAG: hypothetical protein R2736_07975 [Solirubrobacterales bacterium]